MKSFRLFKDLGFSIYNSMGTKITSVYEYNRVVYIDLVKPGCRIHIDVLREQISLEIYYESCQLQLGLIDNALQELIKELGWENKYGF